MESGILPPAPPPPVPANVRLPDLRAQRGGHGSHASAGHGRPSDHLPDLRAAVHRSRQQAESPGGYGGGQQDPLLDPLLKGVSKLYQRRAELSQELRKEFSMTQEVQKELRRRHHGAVGSRAPPVPEPRFNMPSPGEMGGFPGASRLPDIGGRQRPRRGGSPAGLTPPVPPQAPGSAAGDRPSSGGGGRGRLLEPESNGAAPAARRERPRSWRPQRQAASPGAASPLGDRQAGAAANGFEVGGGVRTPQHGEDEVADKRRRREQARRSREAEKDEVRQRQRDEEDAWEREIRRKLEEDEQLRQLAGRRGRRKSEAEVGYRNDATPPAPGAVPTAPPIPSSGYRSAAAAAAAFEAFEAAQAAREQAQAEAMAHAQAEKEAQARQRQRRREEAQKAEARAAEEERRQQWFREQTERHRQGHWRNEAPPPPTQGPTPQAPSRGREEDRRERRRRRAEKSTAHGSFFNEEEGQQTRGREPRSPKGGGGDKGGGGGGMQRSLPRINSRVGAELKKSGVLNELMKQAETNAMKELDALRDLPTKKERQRGYKELLREWHPDKNPLSAEVATAVFQRLQSERGRLGI
eukprot:TRINITY_DN30224_c0_g1_i1.p1 TRINITY_DN30224_c0_g1~~TRINITY_DN30224_c0_g1_i1.p1  ORF type:complete len:580 (+),score=180.34 TRINITY_DN30224_c0_g1_i1:155-1894(+)